MSSHRSDYTAQEKLVAALLDPSCYPHATKGVRLIETHISWVLLAGRYAYKIKKAVDMGFLNFTGLEARRFYCSEEIRLNRRLAPDIYLDVVSIGGSADRPEFGAQPAIEYAVRMRRFPSANLMDRLLMCGKVTPQHIDNLAATITCFHASLPVADAAFGSAASIPGAALQNFGQLHALLADEASRESVAALRAATEAEYAASENFFEKRQAQGCVRECHGDLHLGNIVLIGNQPVPFDGIEFNPSLRWIDVMDEIAFTVMDLLHRDHPELAWRFLNACLQASGDYGGVSVLRFYLAYRATVRAKVCAIRAAQADISSRAKLDELAACRSYLALAKQCLAQHRPALIITHGLPGSGKTTFSQLALEQLGAIRIRSDVERKRLFGLGALDDSRSCVGDIYGAEATRRTYARLHELARSLLLAGYPVIVDAAFLKQHEREQFRKLAQELEAPFVIATLQAEDATLRARITQRRNDASEADIAVLEKLQAVQEPLSPEELACTAQFTTEQASNSAKNSRGWGRLDELLAPV